MEAIVILDEAQIGRSMTRMSHEILERNKGSSNLILLGVKTRGIYLAERLKKKIESIDNVEVDIGTIDITHYRDDKKSDVKDHQDALSYGGKLAGNHVVIVDDVLYTGRTIRAALDVILSKDRPDKISLAVLIDRGHRELPIRADYIGKNIPTSRDEKVSVKLKELDSEDTVSIIKGD